MISRGKHAWGLTSPRFGFFQDASSAHLRDPWPASDWTFPFVRPHTLEVRKHRSSRFALFLARTCRPALYGDISCIGHRAIALSGYQRTREARRARDS